MKSYVYLARRRLEDRGNNILGNLERFMEPQLRFTMRISGDGLDEETRDRMFSGYSEHKSEQEMRAFAADFVPAYTAYAIAELEEKKKDGERHEAPFLTPEEDQEMAGRGRAEPPAARGGRRGAVGGGTGGAPRGDPHRGGARGGTARRSGDAAGP